MKIPAYNQYLNYLQKHSNTINRSKVPEVFIPAIDKELWWTQWYSLSKNNTIRLLSSNDINSLNSGRYFFHEMAHLIQAQLRARDVCDINYGLKIPFFNFENFRKYMHYECEVFSIEYRLCEHFNCAQLIALPCSFTSYEDFRFKLIKMQTDSNKNKVDFMLNLVDRILSYKISHLLEQYHQALQTRAEQVRSWINKPEFEFYRTQLENIAKC